MHDALIWGFPSLRLSIEPMGSWLFARSNDIVGFYPPSTNANTLKGAALLLAFKTLFDLRASFSRLSKPKLDIARYLDVDKRHGQGQFQWSCGAYIRKDR